MRLRLASGRYRASVDSARYVQRTLTTIAAVTDCLRRVRWLVAPSLGYSRQKQAGAMLGILSGSALSQVTWGEGTRGGGVVMARPFIDT